MNDAAKRVANADAIGELDRADLAVLWSTLRSRLEQRPGTLARRPVKLPGLTDAEVVAICGLLGRRRPSKNEINVDLVKLDDALRAGRAQAGLVDVLEALGGPLRDREAERQQATGDRALLWAEFFTHPVAHDERVHRWISSLLRRGRLTRLNMHVPDERVGAVLDTVGVLVERLDLRCQGDLDDTLPIAVLAAELFGDAHTLDVGGNAGDAGGGDRVIATLVADAVMQLSGVGRQQRGDSESLDDISLGESPNLRVAWAKFGVEVDAVNSSVLVLNLAGPDTSLIGAAAAVGEPIRLTSRALRSVDLSALAGRVVWVCENPSVVAFAADRLGERSAPLVCTDGMPKTVTAMLLGQLAAAGAELRVHADFDAGGVAIAHQVMSRFGAAAWRFMQTDYLSAIADRPSLALAGVVGPTSWDTGLAAAMNEHRRAVHEEALVATLLDDLASG